MNVYKLQWNESAQMNIFYDIQDEHHTPDEERLQ